MSLIQNNTSEIRNTFVNLILIWHSENKLNFTWRDFHDPYKILITEILLRKTNAEKVDTLIAGVMKRIGKLNDLLNISESELIEILRPFGMYNLKASELKSLATIITDEFNGQIPDTYNELLRLPGVGNYIASAVLSFGFSQPYAVVDTNVIRVLSRFFSYESKHTRVRDDPGIWSFASILIPHDDLRNYNYAVIDFAKLICTARNPQCNQCPLNSCCHHYLNK